jgi:hypothetical protein
VAFTSANSVRETEKKEAMKKSGDGTRISAEKKEDVETVASSLPRPPSAASSATTADEIRRPHNKKRCVFFGTARGCKNGSGCRFSHGLLAVASLTSSTPPLKSQKQRAGAAVPPKRPSPRL